MLYSNAEIVTELRRVFRQNKNKPFTRRQYELMGTISKTTIENRFEGWNAALVAAGLYDKFQAVRSREQRQTTKVVKIVKKKPTRRTKV